MQSAKHDFEQSLAVVLNINEPLTITTPNGDQVVLMSMDDFTGWRETDYLLSNPANAARLNRAISEVADGNYDQRELAE